MGVSEEKLPARGVKFYFVIKQDIAEKEHTWWQEALWRSSPLSKWFREIQFKYSDHPLLIGDWQGWNLIKVCCSTTHVSLKPSEAKSYYKQIFIRFSEWFIKLCRDRRIECKPYDFQILFRLHPPENPNEFVPIPSLNEVSRSIVSPPSILPNPPTTPTDMSDLAQKILTGRSLEELLRCAEMNKLKVFVGYGVRTEAHASTYELEIYLPDSSEEAESMQRLQGELSYELVLQSEGTATPDFNNVVWLLLMTLIPIRVIDSERVQQIFKNPADYFQVSQGCTRFVLRFDLRKRTQDSELGRALDVAKKVFQKELAGRGYHLYGAVSYELTDEDLTRIESVIRDIVHFRNARPAELFVNLTVVLVDNSYERIIEIARETDRILDSYRIIDFNALPSMATDIEDARKRWDSAMSDLVKDGRSATSFLFFKWVSAVPLEVFTRAREPLCGELNKIAGETQISVTLTSDNQQFARYGCYVAGSRS